MSQLVITDLSGYLIHIYYIIVSYTNYYYLIHIFPTEQMKAKGENGLSFAHCYTLHCVGHLLKVNEDFLTE
jgi:hypothetical protein